MCVRVCNYHLVLVVHHIVVAELALRRASAALIVHVVFQVGAVHKRTALVGATNETESALLNVALQLQINRIE